MANKDTTNWKYGSLEEFDFEGIRTLAPEDQCLKLTP
jgi:hypothetical protein